MPTRGHWQWPLHQKAHQTGSSGHSIWPLLWWLSRFPLHVCKKRWNQKFPFKNNALSWAPRKCLSEQMQMHTHKEGTELCLFGRRLHSWVATAHHSGHRVYTTAVQESVSHSWVDVTCFSPLHLWQQHPKDLSQDWRATWQASQIEIPTQLSQLKCEKWAFFGITRIKAAHAINNASKHTARPFSQGSQLKVWVGIKTAHHSYRDNVERYRKNDYYVLQCLGFLMGPWECVGSGVGEEHNYLEFSSLK